MKISVVIPFFQREPGLLSRAVASVAAQVLPTDCMIDIIVVDDGSPTPARDESLVVLPTSVRLRILEQNNQGVGAARNAGLDAAEPDTTVVAFLDSDDVWAPTHLSNAVEQIGDGADFYFDNNIIDDGVDAFSYSAFIQRTHGILDDRRPITAVMTGPVGFETILQECLPHTSQVAYNFNRHREVRFKTDLRRAGEDHLFWLTLASRSKKIVYSTMIGGRRGFGVSIYRETLGWDSPNGLSRLADEILLRSTISGSFDLSKSHRSLLRRDAQKSHDHFLFLALRNARRQPSGIASALRRVLTENPSSWGMFARAVFHLPNHVRDLREQRAMTQASGLPSAVSAHVSINAP